MGESSQSERAAPEFRVRINGNYLPAETATDIKSIAIEEDLDTPGMFSFEMINWDMDRLRMKWSDSSDFAEGKPVEIVVGFREKVETIISAEITGLQLKINGKQTPTFEVRGYDRRHRLMRGRKTQSFLQMKDSDIAKKIISDAGLKAQTDDTDVTFDYVLQHNQTDFDFLLERARRIGFELVAEDKTVSFRRRRHDRTEVLSLNRETDLIEFCPRLTTMGQTSDYKLRGWDIKKKAQITSNAAPGSEIKKMGDSNLGPSAAQQAFGTQSAISVDIPVSSQNEADQIARGRFNEMALAYITGSGVCIGNTKLRAGTVVKMIDLGSRFSGQYYVTSTSHTYLPSRGYRTAFTVRRNAT